MSENRRSAWKFLGPSISYSVSLTVVPHQLNQPSLDGSL